MSGNLMILHGGGARGAFTMGALNALVAHRIDPEYFGHIVAESIGGTCGYCYCAGLVPEGCAQLTAGALIGTYARWNLLPRHDVLGVHIVRPLRLDLFIELLTTQFGFRAEVLRNPRAPQLDVLATNCTTGTTDVITLRDLESEALMLRALMASKALIPLHGPVELRGAHYIDGGLRTGPMLTEELLDTAERIVVVMSVPRNHVFAPVPRWAPGLAFPLDRHMRRLIAGVRAVHTAELERLVRLERQGRITLIAPDAPLVGPGRLMRSDFDARGAVQAAVIHEGERIARGTLRALPA